MALALWAKSAVGTNLPFVKGFGKAYKSCREILQQVLQRKAAAKTKIYRPDHGHAIALERCIHKPAVRYAAKSSLQSRISRLLFSRTMTKTLASELRRRSALGLSSSSCRDFRRLPIMSLIGLTLGLDVSTYVDDSSEKMMSEMQSKFRNYTWQMEPLDKLPQSLKDLEISLDSIASGCEGAVYKAKMKIDKATPSTIEPEYYNDTVTDNDYNLAVKAVFNYGAESNSLSILRALEREIVPMHAEGCQIDSTMWKRMTQLPPHPNIVDMPGMFVDDMLITEEGLQKFPAAMPNRLNPELHFGRNKTLYLIMRRRSTHLRDYLASHDVNMETRCLMLAQLLEGVTHMELHGIAHRDLKSDNVLVDVPASGDIPRLEICDFGCCLAEEDKSLLVPYPTRDIYMGGNSWLMAPEIVTAVPGPNSFLDFRKSDLWAAGTIAYEILGGQNPFYPGQESSQTQLSSRSYSQDQLPALPDGVPGPVRRLVKSLLARDPKKRPTASVAASVVQMVVLEGKVSPQQNNCSDNEMNAIVSKKKSNGRRLSPVAVALRKEKEKFMWIMANSLAMLCQLIFSNQSEGWDVKSAMNFLLLSRLNYADFQEALKFL